MHEVSLALGLLEIAEETCREKGYRIIETVKIRVGQAAGVNLDSLFFALEAIKKGTLAEKANFIMELVPLGGYCQNCGKNFETAEFYIFNCPLCGSSTIQICQGKELEISEMDVA